MKGISGEFENNQLKATYTQILGDTVSSPKPALLSRLKSIIAMSSL